MSILNRKLSTEISCSRALQQSLGNLVLIATAKGVNADLDVGGDGDSHHAIVGEEGERQEREKQVPEELGCAHKATALSLSVSIFFLQPCSGP